MHPIDQIMEERCPNLMKNKILWSFIKPYILKVFKYYDAKRIVDDISEKSGFECFTYLTNFLQSDHFVKDINNVPKSGPIILAGNHPTGLTDGIVMFDVLKDHRPDYTLYANSDMIKIAKGFQDIIIPVDWNEKNKYWGMTSKEIQDLWKENGRVSSTAGTKMHYDIECFYNDCEVEVEEDNIEWNYFEKFEADIGSKMEPYRTEWMVWDKELKFAGSIDMIYENDDGSLELYDWKRSKGIKFGNDWESATTECIKHLPNCNYMLYSLQLNTYKAILEKNYGKKVKGMYLVVLHPNNRNKSYHRIPVDDLQKEVADLFELRKKMLQKRT